MGFRNGSWSVVLNTSFASNNSQVDVFSRDFPKISIIRTQKKAGPLQVSGSIFHFLLQVYRHTLTNIQEH